MEQIAVIGNREIPPDVKIALDNLKKVIPSVIAFTLATVLIKYYG